MSLTLCPGCSHMEDVRAAMEMRTPPEVCGSGLNLVTSGFFLSSLTNSDLKCFLKQLKPF